MKRFPAAILIAFTLSCFTAVQADPLAGGKKVSLDLDGVPLVQVINALAQQNHFNVVYASKIQGSVTMHLESVDLSSALTAVLIANGYTYITKDDIVIVKDITTEMPGDLSSRSITLSYANPEAVAKAVESQLSARGKVVILAPDKGEGTGGTVTFRANTMVITDYPGILDDVVALVNKIDIPERTILIEAKIIETSIDAERRLGFIWPSSISGRATGIRDAVTNKNTGGVDMQGGRWTWGTLSVAQLDATLNFLETEGNSKLLSDPRITATENHQAEIKIATVIPIQTLSRFTEGAATQDIVTFEDEEIGISLRVTPRINAEGTITLDVNPQVDDIIGYTGPADNQRPIKTTRSITTRVTIQDGETVVLGGLLKMTPANAYTVCPCLVKYPFWEKRSSVIRKPKRHQPNL